MSSTDSNGSSGGLSGGLIAGKSSSFRISGSTETKKNLNGSFNSQFNHKESHSSDSKSPVNHSNNHSDSDLYEGPSSHFPGNQQFFFRFIVMTDNFRYFCSFIYYRYSEITCNPLNILPKRFTQCLSEVISAEISLLSPTDYPPTTRGNKSNTVSKRKISSSPRLTSGMGLASSPLYSTTRQPSRSMSEDVEGDGDPVVNRFAQVSVDEGDGKFYFSSSPRRVSSSSRLRAESVDMDAGLGPESSSPSSSLPSTTSTEPFSLRILKLKLLGRFLGLVTFWHQRTLTLSSTSEVTGASGSSNASRVGPLHQLALENTRKRSKAVMRSILPLKAVLIRAWQEGRLCLTLPWVIEFLKMSAWDTATAATAVSTGGSNSSNSMHS